MRGAISKGGSNNRWLQREVGAEEGRVAVCKQLDKDGQVDFKGSPRFSPAPIFSHRFSLTQTQPGEKLLIFLDFLAPKLPVPIEEDLSRGILEAIDMDSYRTEKAGGDQNPVTGSGCEIEPIPTGGEATSLNPSWTGYLKS
jgi:type I restriction enzyme, R subunit